MKRLVPLFALALAAAFPLSAPAARLAPAQAVGAASPAGVTCAAGDPVVWVNTQTKVYHMAGSTYYGNTKHGKYACASDAAKMGAHAAKGESGTSGSTAGSTTGSGSMSSGSSTASGKHHHHHRKGGGMASPLPAPSPM